MNLLLPPRLRGNVRKPKAARLRVRFANVSAALILKGQAGDSWRHHASRTGRIVDPAYRYRRSHL